MIITEIQKRINNRDHLDGKVTNLEAAQATTSDFSEDPRSQGTVVGWGDAEEVGGSNKQWVGGGGW